MHPLIVAYYRRRQFQINAEPTKGPSSPYYPQYLRYLREMDEWIDELVRINDQINHSNTI